MTRTRLRAVVIGAGVESLVAANLLARAGLHTCVVEKRHEAGGRFGPWPAATGAPVSRVFDHVPTLHPAVAGWLRREHPRLELDTVGVSVCCRDRNGRDLVLTGQPELDHQSISRISTSDAEKYPVFLATLGRLAGVLAPLLQRAPPGTSSVQDAWAAIVMGRRYLGLSKREMFELLRWPPMPVADLVEEWFASEPLRALVAMRGLNGVFAGPRSAGTSAVLLMQAAAAAPVSSSTSIVRCGAPALVGALVASLSAHAGTLRTNAEVVSILVAGNRAAGVLLKDGTHVEADLIVSGLGARRTLLDLVDPDAVPAEIARRVTNIRTRGTRARALLMVDDTAPFRGLNESHAGRVSVWHSVSTVDDLERGFDAIKYGTWSARPWLEASLHPIQTTAPDARRWALSVTAHQVPPPAREPSRPEASARLEETMLATLEDQFPGATNRIVERFLATPEDLASDLGLPGGHHLHAELALDQLWMARPALGLGGYRTAVAGLYLCGPGTHPGVGPLGGSGMLASRAVLRDARSAVHPFGTRPIR